MEVMKKVTHLLLVMFLSVILFACKTTQPATENLYTVSLTSVYDMNTDTLNSVQVDSMINVDKLPKYKKWQKVYLRDFETKIVYEYSTLYDKTSNIIYTIKYIKEDNLFIVKKRKITNK